MKKVVISTLVASLVASSLLSLSASAAYSDAEIQRIEELSGNPAVTTQVDTVNEENPVYEEMCQAFDKFCEANHLDRSLDSLRKFEETYFSSETIPTDPDDAILNLRATCSLAAMACGLAGYPMIEETLSHSCTDNPSDLRWDRGTEFSEEIRTCPAYQDLVDEIKSELKNVTSKTWANEYKIALESPTDVKLSIRHADVAASAIKHGSTWDIYIGLSDTYDFGYIKSAADTGVSEFVRFANNYANMAQDLGAINPYMIFAYTHETY